MNHQIIQHIAEIIQEHRTWIRVVSADRYVEMHVRENGVLIPLSLQALTLQSYHPRPGFSRTRIWQINERDLTRGLTMLCLQDPDAKQRAEQNQLTTHDVERIVETASFGIVKLELYDYDS